MKYLILGMIFSGSALMVYNIIRFAIFIRKNNELEKKDEFDWRTAVPLLLLIFFLIGYVVVGLSGIANIMIASILLGGSIFVSMLLFVLYSIVGHVRDTEQILARRYDEIKDQITAITKDSIATFIVNLTKDEIEERSGEALYDSDYESDSYSDMIRARGQHVIEAGFLDSKGSVFTRDGLLDRFNEGITDFSEVLLIRRNDGTASFVKFKATMTKKPVSGDVVAFIVERPYNEEVVRQTLFEKVLMDEYDRIAYLINGSYKVIASNAGKKKGLLLKDDDEDTYESIYFNYILPAMEYDRNKNDGKPNPLRLSVIEKELAENGLYVVDAPFTVDGELLYKHFFFYLIDKNAKFYLMLLSDSTKMREEQDTRNRELSEALDAAVRSNESRIRFFTNISHNIRTPLNGVLGFANLASQEKDVATIRSYLTKLTASGQRLLSMMNDLFTMSLIESGALSIESEPTDLAALVSGVVSRMIEAHPEKELTITADVSALPDGLVMCDEGRVTQIVERLLENSVIFAPEKGTVSLSVSKESDKEPTYLFCVKNKGQRIPDDVIDHIFEPEMWSMTGAVGDDSGAGIGMTVSKALIDRMGGTAKVISDGDDITFEIRLPLESAVGEQAPEDLGDLGSLTLLVADDSEVNREIAQLILTGEGHKVDLAADGSEAVELMKSSGGKYDAVLMDVHMPMMNGYEATAAIRALDDPELSSVPVIAVTANAYQEDQNAAYAAGMNGYVTKPINPDDIRAALKKALLK